MALVASLAFSARQPPPPAIAELTPQAQHQITKAPPELANGIGEPTGAGSHRAGVTTSSAAPQPGASSSPGPLRVASVPSAHHCFGSPPMQIATDTQSPPCVAYWAGDNGGATSRGVTATTVRVGVPIGTSAGDFPARMVTDLQLFLNRNFELYGRQLDLIQGGHGANNCTGAAASADASAAADLFAVGDAEASSDSCFDGEAARDHLIFVNYINGFGLSSSVLRTIAPYGYTYDMPYDEQFAEDGAFVCSQLAHKTARYAPDASLALARRKFGLVLVHDDTPWNVTIASLQAALSRCGAAIPSQDIEQYSEVQQGNNAAEDLSEFDVTAITRMHTDGVTTVLCADLCGGFINGPIVCGAASSQSYHPEWLFMNANVNTNVVEKLDWPCSDEQAADLNLVYQPPQVPYPAEPLNRALNEVDPGYEINSALDLEEAIGGYEQLLLIASGIQMAGPDLNPYTFERGLQLARFPNPYSADMEGAASFAGGTLSMTTDAVVAWYNPSAPSVYSDEGAGSWCYAERAKRFTPADWATAPNILPPVLAAAPCAGSPPGS